MGPKSANKPKRTPKPDARHGEIEAVPSPPPIDNPPDVRQYGLCPKLTDPAKKPTHGATMMVRSNYVRVSKVPKTLYVYSLAFYCTTKEGVHMEYNKRREIRDAFQTLIKADTLNLKADRMEWVTDFKTLWTTTPIHGRDEKGYTFQSDEFAYTQQNGKEIKNMRAEVSNVDYFDDIENALRTKHIASLPEYIRALNANVAQCIEKHQNTTGKTIDRVGANKFYVSNGYKVMNGLRAVRGYFTSIRPGTDTTLLNINPATSAFLPPVTVSNFIRGIGSENIAYASQLLQGATLKIRYRRLNYTDSDIDYNSEAARLKIFTQIGSYYADQQKFYELVDRVEGQSRMTKPSDNGTTVFRYFTDKARVRFPAGTAKQSPEMYCINVGKRVKSLKTRIANNTKPDDKLMRDQSAQGAQWIPACLLQIVPGQVVKTTLGPIHTSQMIRHALRLPAENVGLIEEEGLEIMGVKSGRDGQQPLASMGFAVDDELIEVPATQLPQPKLTYGPSSGNSERTPRLGSWDVKGVTFAFPSTFKKVWILAMPDCFGGRQVELTGVYSSLVTLLRAHGLKFDAGVPAEQVCTKESLFKQDDNALPMGQPKPSRSPEDIVRKFLNSKCAGSDDCGFILIPEKSYETYAMAKRLADFGGRTILFAIGSKFVDGNPDQFMSNLALKVNIRFGGDNHRFNPAEFNSVLSLETRRNTIVIGADIAHCGGGGKEGSPSIACLVGSNDSSFMSYPGSMRLQRGGQENIENDHMFSMIQERLQGWQRLYNANSSMKKPDKNKWPSNMIFFRDGISESQFQACIDEEIQTIKRAYRDLCKRDVTLTFVVCGKRHHTRFYATQKDQTYTQKMTISGKQIPDAINGNLQPGLLVTDVVTNPTPFNFFLQSHKAIKGTARSAHYHVLEDGMKLGRKRLPELTMMLCYAFSRATTGVSYAAPAYLADRLCERGRVYLRAWNLDPDMEPKFVVPVETDQMGKRQRVIQEKVDEAKKAFVQQLSETQSIWGKHYGTKPDALDGRKWLNPWNPSLLVRDGMFWM